MHTLFAYRGRAKPFFPMACYTLYTCAVVTWLMQDVLGFQTLKQLTALSSAVGMIGETPHRRHRPGRSCARRCSLT